MMFNSHLGSTPLVEMSSVCRTFTRPNAGSLCVLDGVNLTIHPGQFHALTGKSGSGKSTLMQMVALFDRPTSGSIKWQGKDAMSLSSKVVDRARQDLFGFVHQSHHLLQGMSALDNVGLPLRISGLSLAQSRVRRGMCRAHDQGRVSIVLQ